MEKTWRITIGSRPKLWNVDFKEIWQYKSLVWMLFKRNYSLQYKQTILGPLWMIFNVIFSTGIFTLVFGYVGKMSSDGVPYFLFCLSGNVIWNLFSTCFNSNTRVLMENSYLFGKVYFPRLIVPISNALLCIVRSLLQFMVCLAGWLFYLIRGEVAFMGLSILGTLPLLLLASLMGTAAGIIISSLTVKYRDFDHLTGIAMSALMYISPVLYPTSQLSPLFRKLVYFNPMSAPIEAFRYCLTGTGTIYWPGMLYSIGLTVVLLILGLIMYGRAEKSFIDIV
ncbi:MAG: ABC transporter permease [Lachnospiraceae bacterium]|nr:ABC transporter permease [Lachnospiraceae bacterium]